MSELKTYKMVDEKYCTDCVCVIPSEVCLKEDVYKVLAEKDKEIVELKQEIERLKQENEMTLIGVNLRSPTTDGRFI